MKTLRFVMYLFYRYYSKAGTRRIPYFSALGAVVFLIYIHIFQVLIIFDQVSLLPLDGNDAPIMRYGKLALVFLPIFVLIALLVKPSDLKSLNYDKNKVRLGGIRLIVYIAVNVVLLFVLMGIFRKVTPSPLPIVNQSTAIH